MFHNSLKKIADMPSGPRGFMTIHFFKRGPDFSFIRNERWVHVVFFSDNPWKQMIQMLRDIRSAARVDSGERELEIFSYITNI